MDDNKKRNILIIMFGIIILMLIFMIYLLISNNYKNSNEEDYDRLEIVDTNKGDKNIDEVVSDTSKGDNQRIEVVDNSDDNGANNNISSNSENNSYSEDDVISYFEGNEKEVKNGSFKEKFKEYFIEIVDFIFYGTEIKGYTFNKLTNTGKLKVIGAALKIDSLIENRVPGYKDSIKGTGSKVYTNTKEKLTELFLDISTNICKDRGDDCEKAKDLFGEIKSTCKIGWSFIKKLLKNGGNKLKDWYEIYSGK